jgi:hypothetical protein
MKREPTEFEFSRVVCGKNSGSMEAQCPQCVAQENARKHQELFPLAAETVLKSTYMDDSLDSAENEEEGVHLYHELKELWEKASLLCRPTLAGLGPPRTVCLLWLAIRLPVVCH